MIRRNLPRLLLAALIVLVALALILIAFLPYGALKGIADSLVRDNNFVSLRESNALIFRVLLISAGVALLAVAGLVATGRLRDVRAWFRRVGADGRELIRAITPARSERGFLAALLLIVLVALIYRLAQIDAPMTHDEAYTYVAFSSTSLFNIITNYDVPNNHVLNSILMFLSTRALGIQPWAVRLPALLAGLLLVPACYALGKAIYDPYTGLTGALFLAILPGAVVFSTAGRGYSLVALFTLLALWMANYVRGSRNLVAWSLLVLCCALGFYSVPVMLFPFGIIFGWLFFENLVTEPGPYGSRAHFLRYWFVAGLATAALVLLLYTPIFIYSGADKVFANHWVTPQPWRGYVASIPRHASAVWHQWTDSMPTLLGLILIAGFILSVIFHRRLSQQRFPLQAATFIWLAALLLIQRPQGVTKIWAFLQAPFLIWVAAGTVGLLRDIRPKFARGFSIGAIVFAAALACALAGAALLLPTLPDRWAARGPAEKALLAIKERLGQHDLILVDSAYAPAVWYYSRLHGVPQVHFDNRLSFDRLFVIDARNTGESLDAIIRAQCSHSCPINLDSAQLIANFRDLDVLQLSTR